MKYPLAGLESNDKRTKIKLGNATIGGGNFSLIAGPCSVESWQQISTIAKAVSQNSAVVLRGGAFKPRTSPYSFQGLGVEGLRLLKESAKMYKLACVSEVMSEEDVAMVAEQVDILQIGARNMQNFSLLKRVGQIKKPVLLKRGFCATYDELLSAAEYILGEGNSQVILCERGIRTFETTTRNTLDLAAVPILKKLTHLPVIVDPSHGTGVRELIAPMSKAALVAGADGVMIEVHPDPDSAQSDREQTISIEQFIDIVADLKKIAEAIEVPL